MFQKVNRRKTATKVLAFVCCLATLVGSLAFFTDRESQSTTGPAGNIDLVFTDISSSKTGANSITSNNEFAIDKSWGNEALVSDGNVINPGDYFDLTYTVANEDNKSMDVRQQLIVTSTVPMTADAQEYTLVIPDENSTTNLCLYNGVKMPNIETLSGNDLDFDIIYELNSFYITVPGHIYLVRIFIDTSTTRSYWCVTTDQLRDQLNEWGFSMPSVNEWVELTVTLPSDFVTPVPIWCGEPRSTYGDADSNEYYGLFSEPVLVNGAFIPGTMSADKFSITYDLADIVLNGSVETEEGIAVTEKTYKVQLDFAETAKNAFQDSNVTVTYKAQAKQHRNTTDSDWTDWATYESAFEQIQ